MSQSEDVEMGDDPLNNEAADGEEEEEELEKGLVRVVCFNFHRLYSSRTEL